MDSWFKITMFITSFIPLWISIVFSNIWNIWYEGRKLWNSHASPCQNLQIILLGNRSIGIFTLIILALAMISSFTLVHFINDQHKSTNKHKMTVKAARANKSLSSDFLLAYILPMVTFDFSNLKSIILFIICFITLAYLCVRNNNVYVNILLEVMGYHMFTCNLETSINGNSFSYENTLVISKEDLTARINNQINCYDFDKYIYIDLYKE
ncbi:hypothetical protein [Lactobacillus delbrueckii]|uniref:hypothetical protein n=1 Tax=Lactobacillus delbrueckii TaxID=1584 RepID=UPI001E4C83D5|nr:hypothetical protein [Lactobacillus delbrueckii]MCD5505652.1 hypothetical protein [Lactobacillus delbrueckii subsp. lactis]